MTALTYRRHTYNNNQIAARLGKTAPGGEAAPPKEAEEGAEEEDSSQQTDEAAGDNKDGGGAGAGGGQSQIDKAIYEELRARRDFGFEQDLGLELEKRNITKEAEAAKIVDAGLDQMPGVSSSTTFLPNQELTPREVGTYGLWPVVDT